MQEEVNEKTVSLCITGGKVKMCIRDRDEYLEFITHQPYDAMGDFSFLLDEKSDKAENTTVENENMNAD